MENDNKVVCKECGSTTIENHYHEVTKVDSKWYCVECNAHVDSLGEVIYNHDLVN